MTSVQRRSAQPRTADQQPTPQELRIPANFLDKISYVHYTFPLTKFYFPLAARRMGIREAVAV